MRQARLTIHFLKTYDSTSNVNNFFSFYSFTYLSWYLLLQMKMRSSQKHIYKFLCCFLFIFNDNHYFYLCTHRLLCTFRTRVYVFFPLSMHALFTFDCNKRKVQLRVYGKTANAFLRRLSGVSDGWDCSLLLCLSEFH